MEKSAISNFKIKLAPPIPPRKFIITVNSSKWMKMAMKTKVSPNILNKLALKNVNSFLDDSDGNDVVSLGAYDIRPRYI